MGKKKKNPDEAKAVVAEFSVSMYCNACERTVAKTISKLKGVEKFMTDMNKHKVVVTGKIDPQQVLKKLRKKTGKRVEIVKNDNELLDHDKGHLGAQKDGTIGSNCVNLQGVDWTSQYYCNDPELLLMMFNDENPNACSVM